MTTPDKPLCRVCGEKHTPSPVGFIIYDHFFEPVNEAPQEIEKCPVCGNPPGVECSMPVHLGKIVREVIAPQPEKEGEGPYKYRHLSSRYQGPGIDDSRELSESDLNMAYREGRTSCNEEVERLVEEVRVLKLRLSNFTTNEGKL